MTNPSFIVGIDLGQAHDFTAISVLQTSQRPTEHDASKTENAYQLRHLERLPLATSYPEQVERIARVVSNLRSLPLDQGGGVNPRIVVDQTGVGRPVVDMLRTAGLTYLMAVTIHGGDQTNREGNDWRVPKRELVSVLQVLLQSKRLQIANALKDAETLTREMLSFKVTISSAGHDSYGNDWRLNSHDDLVLATALSTWEGERCHFVPVPPLNWS